MECLICKNDVPEVGYLGYVTCSCGSTYSYDEGTQLVTIGGTCGNCKYFFKSNPPYGVPSSLGHCKNLVDIDDKGYGEVPKNGAGLDYPVCHLIVGPDFGCRNFELKD